MAGTQVDPPEEDPPEPPRSTVAVLEQAAIACNGIAEVLVVLQREEPAMICRLVSMALQVAALSDKWRNR